MHHYDLLYLTSPIVVISSGINSD